MSGVMAYFFIIEVPFRKNKTEATDRSSSKTTLVADMQYLDTDLRCSVDDVALTSLSSV